MNLEQQGGCPTHLVILRQPADITQCSSKIALTFNIVTLSTFKGVKMGVDKCFNTALLDVEQCRMYIEKTQGGAPVEATGSSTHRLSS